MIAGGGPLGAAKARKVSWDWVGILAVGGFGAGCSAALAAAVQRESARLRVARAGIEQLRPRLRPRTEEAIGGQGPVFPPRCR